MSNNPSPRLVIVLLGALGILAAPVVNPALAADEPAATTQPAQDGDHADHADHADAHMPAMDPLAQPADHSGEMFRPDPTYTDKPYEPQDQLDIYGAKHLNPTQRPLLEWNRELYNYGPFKPGINLVGERNLLFPQVLVFGDWRTAVAANDNGAVEQSLVATRLNLNVDVRVTATERVHLFFRPLDKGGQFTRYVFGGEDDEEDGELELDGNLDAVFFEGDLGAIASGVGGEPAKFDLPFAVGKIPLLFQNGIWVEDAFYGAAFTIPARNSKLLDISNFDITFFAGFDDVSTAAVDGDSNADLYGVTGFFEMLEGYLELGYGYVHDNDDDLGDGSYHNFTAGFSRRYGHFLSNAVRVIVNVGQDPGDGFEQTADGVILLIENAFVTSQPNTLIPYLNFWAGFDHPQSLARDAGAGGVLKNTGINFETDGLTGFPKMDDTGINTYGFAAGIEYLFNLDRQIVFEVAGLKVHDDDDDRVAQGDQLGLGVRYQHPITNAIILRVDAIYAFISDGDDLAGVRFEVRWKF